MSATIKEITAFAGSLIYLGGEPFFLKDNTRLIGCEVLEPPIPQNQTPLTGINALSEPPPKEC